MHTRTPVLWLALMFVAGPFLKGDDLASHSDEFNDPATLRNWKSFSTVENWPDRIKIADIGKTSPGHLYLVPHSAAWWRGYHGVFLFKEIQGDFAVTTRLKVTGVSGGLPAQPWTISGLMVRRPGDLSLEPGDRTENWIYLMAGRGPEAAWVVDAKSTRNSVNEWNITPSGGEWVSLRIVRLGPWFLYFTRHAENGPWAVRQRFLRDDMPASLQVGINATSDVNLSATMTPAMYNGKLRSGRPPDNITRYDYVRFHRPTVSDELKQRLVRGSAVSDRELIAALCAN